MLAYFRNLFKENRYYQEKGGDIKISISNKSWMLIINPTRGVKETNGNVHFVNAPFNIATMMKCMKIVPIDVKRLNLFDTKIQLL